MNQKDYYDYDDRYDRDQDHDNNESDIKTKKIKKKVEKKIIDKKKEEKYLKSGVKLRNDQGIEYIIPIKECELSNYLIELLRSNNNQIVIDLNDWSTILLEKVVSYFEFHKGIRQQPILQPLRSAEMKKVCKCKWDAFFIDDITEKDQTDLYRLLMFAYRWKIFPLYDLCCAKLTSLIKGKPMYQFSQIVG